MSDPVIRLAAPSDVEELLEMRRDFAFEDLEPGERISRADYEDDFRVFFLDAVDSGRWQIWLAEIEGRVVAHVFVALIDRVPRPARERRRLAYLTNVYTRPAYRGRGIGAELVAHAQAEARAADAELMIVWPSDESMAFYKRHGFASPGDALIWGA